ncbi:hypothetical protein [Sinorhizobium medicae]|uniref:hypothetical protein n=1 Tax=Sinorhizobium medicae TaxID=110321 RepID=UPI000FDA2C86|nr:hypothetical protein [Sinorhizobium medicae]RVJ77340.1 hypothetical protein CN168_19525 [Sinorhizobium medicae]
MQILRPLLGKLNQGVIFSCARAERYGGCAIYGVVITARCDLAQDKFPVLNYIPVVKLDDWLLRDGFEILHSRAAGDVESRLHSALDNAAIAKSILNSQPPRQILEAIFRAQNADKKIRNAEPKFAEIVERYELINSLSESGHDPICDLFEMNAALAKALLKELALNRLTGYYFLPAVTDDGEKSGYVALMREVSRLPRELAMRIANGLDADDGCLATNPSWATYVSFEHEPFAMPIGEIPSPAIEHFLQTFSALFGRIGLDDIEPTYLASITERRPARNGEAQ